MGWHDKRRDQAMFTDDTPLKTVVETYVATGCGRTGRVLSEYYIGQIAKVLQLFLLAIRKPEATAGDLTPEAVERFVRWHAAMFPKQSGAFGRTVLCSWLRYLGKMPDGRGRNSKRRRPPLSDDPDTLWGICLREYFPTNVRIQSEKTVHQYKIALADFREAIGREPTPDDLTDDNVGLLMNLLLSKGAAKKTANERRGRINALWRWLANRRRVEMFPTNYKLKEPRRIPKAWSADELKRIFLSCREEPGFVAHGVLACDWWSALHSMQWDTGERIGALMACRWSWLDWNTHLLEIPAEARKGQDADMLYRLHPRTLAILKRMEPAGHELIFPWPFNQVAFYLRLKRILKRVGLEHDRKSKTHRMRRSVASHLQAAGIDACTALGHSSADVTRKSYLDPRIVVTQHPIDVLFDPRGSEPALPPAAEPLAIEYREPGETFDPAAIDWL